jgi:hypothetical protein
MRYLKRFNEEFNEVSIFDSAEWRHFLPQSITLVTDTGKWTLNLPQEQNGVGHATNITNLANAIQITYRQNTTDDKWEGSAVKDGEPDYLGIDITMLKKNVGTSANPDTLTLRVEITYGDSMKNEFTVDKEKVKVDHYDGFGSMRDPKTRFGFDDDSLKGFVRFINCFGFEHNVEDYNFIDSNLDSYKPNDPTKQI